jgi:hypothetical protein
MRTSQEASRRIRSLFGRRSACTRLWMWFLTQWAGSSQKWRCGRLDGVAASSSVSRTGFGPRTVSCCQIWLRMARCLIASGSSQTRAVTVSFHESYPRLPPSWLATGGASLAEWRCVPCAAVGFASGSANPKGAIPRIPLNLALLNERRIVGCLWGAWRPRDGGEVGAVVQGQ